MIHVDWDEVFHWVGMIVCWVVCLTPVWVVLYFFIMVWAFAGPPWAGLLDNWKERRRKKRDAHLP